MAVIPVGALRDAGGLYLGSHVAFALTTSYHHRPVQALVSRLPRRRLRGPNPQATGLWTSALLPSGRSARDTSAYPPSAQLAHLGPQAVCQVPRVEHYRSEWVEYGSRFESKPATGPGNA